MNKLIYGADQCSCHATVLCGKECITVWQARGKRHIQFESGPWAPSWHVILACVQIVAAGEMPELNAACKAAEAYPQAEADSAQVLAPLQ